MVAAPDSLFTQTMAVMPGPPLSLPELAGATEHDFKAGMRLFASGVSIVATSVDGCRFGATVSSVASLSVAPPSLTVSVHNRSQTHAAIMRRRALSINVLEALQADLARRFAGHGGVQGDARFQDELWSRSPDGIPVLNRALVTFQCTVSETIPLYTHTLFVCLVNGIIRTGGEALVYRDGIFRRLAPDEALPATRSLGES